MSWEDSGPGRELGGQWTWESVGRTADLGISWEDSRPGRELGGQRTWEWEDSGH